MNRRTFTKNLAKLIDFMIDNGDEPVLDYAMRSRQEQQRLFDLELSKCDGEIKISNHQKGIAADLYLVFDDKVDYNWTDKTKLNLYHYKWEELGGKPMISFKTNNGDVVVDSPHFEG